MCGAPDQDATLTGVADTETVIQGRVVRDGAPAASAYVRLLDGSGEFTAEVPTGASGGFRFFAAPGTWTLRALAPGAQAEQAVAADRGVTDVTLELA